MIEQKKSNLIFAIVVIALCALTALIFIYDRNKTQNFANQFTDNSTSETANIEENENNQTTNNNSNKADSTDIPTLYCVGDSTTLGIEDQNNAYPAYIDKCWSASKIRSYSCLR